ncbi:TIGR01777 family protein [Psychromonas sp. RZ22]|uniref:TIGR01777 family oxidoreductase n=1 Tax=Psychromonas algarum TaxID=2555643 RepID=UPI001067DFD6|nr:TIGR01777 family oxidoreductase [Psychromonas sp. RZ22]TEW54110.1 TIGR01777 family protein [Psychromonas sp. RZ22]
MGQTTEKKTNVLISGASGLIGSALKPFLEEQGYSVYTLSRSVNNSSPYWNIQQQKIHLNGAPFPDIIIHLAGENIVKSRWTKEVKQEIIKSRLQSTQLLVDYINRSTTPPSLFICASAIGFYGDCKQQQVNENTKKGKQFVSDLADHWEQITQQIKQSTTRVVNLRTGIVLSKNGGALEKILTPFKLGLGGKIGTGEQIMSWIDLQDQLNAILFIMQHVALSGPINLVSPHPVSNKEFSTTLANILKRPCLIPLPRFIIKLLFSQMGEELLLSSTNVHPTKLLQAGFKFERDLLEKSLQKQLM